MKKYHVFMLAAAFAIGTLLVCGITGCDLLTQEQVDAVHAAVLAKVDEAWAEKGAVAVEQKTAQLVADGKLTEAQAAALNAAAQQGYDALRAKMAEMMAGKLENAEK